MSAQPVKIIMSDPGEFDEELSESSGDSNFGQPQLPPLSNVGEKWNPPVGNGIIKATSAKPVKVVPKPKWLIIGDIETHSRNGEWKNCEIEFAFITEDKDGFTEWLQNSIATTIENDDDIENFFIPIRSHIDLYLECFSYTKLPSNVESQTIYLTANVKYMDY